MSTLGFAVLAMIVALYVVTDGYVLGLAIVMPFIARGDRERAAMMRSIVPFWNGNEVWLISAGAVHFALFPRRVRFVVQWILSSVHARLVVAHVPRTRPGIA